MNNEFENSFENETENINTPDPKIVESSYDSVSLSDEDSFSEPEAQYESEASSEGKQPKFNITYNVKEKKKGKLHKKITVLLVCSLFCGACFAVGNGLFRKFILPWVGLSSNTEIETTKVELNKVEGDAVSTSRIAAIAEGCMPSVVAITNKSVSDVMTFFGTYEQESTSSGSGIVIGKNETELLIVTNYHVVANSKELSVVFSVVENMIEKQGKAESDIDDALIPPATVKGYDSNKDLAVIAVKLSDIPEEILSGVKIATLGDSSKLMPGDQVVAIGNALGYGQSVTTGIISAVNRKITMKGADGSSVVTNSFIQTDAAINSGNSGGALLDMAGNVIGINSVKIATTGVEGMGYAIPISDVEYIIDELVMRKTRDVVAEDKQGFLGIVGTDVSSSTSQTFGLPVGVYISEVSEGLAAEKAGLKKGYIIVKFDGYTITTIAQLQDRLRYYSEGEKITVTVEVPGAAGYTQKEFEVKLSNRSKNIAEE